MSDYQEMTAEQYRTHIAEALERIDSVKILRYFCIFICEKLKRIDAVEGGASNE